MRIAVLSDIHGNATALAAAAAQVEALSPDHLVILGDLLTYGPDVAEVFDRLDALASRFETSWIWGNHEEIYDDLAKGQRDYLDSVADWVRQSVEHTAEGVDVSRLRRIPWARELETEGLLFAHANPFGDWRYVNSVADHAESAERLHERGFHAGVFGHTHRSRLYAHPRGTGATDDHPRTESLGKAGDEVVVANAGSVGQPRNRTATSTFLTIDVSPSAYAFDIHTVAYDVHQHVASVLALPLPAATTQRLAGFFHTGE